MLRALQRSTPVPLPSGDLSPIMRRAVVLVLALSICVGCARPTPRNGSVDEAPVIATSRSVDAVLDDYYEAVGGYQRIKGVRARRMRGVYHEGKLLAQTEIVQMRPNLRRVVVHGGAWDHYEGFDGAPYEFHRDSGKAGRLSRVTGEAALAIVRGAEFDESFVDYGARGFKAALVGRETLQGLDVYRVRIMRTDDWALDFLFDVHSHLLVGLQKAMPLHAEGPPITSLTLYSDWRFTGGLLVPFSGMEVKLATGEVMNTLRWDSIELNGAVAPDELNPPTQ